MAAISGTAKNTTEQFKKLTETQQQAHTILTEYGVASQEALNDVNNFGGVVEYSSGQVRIQNAVVKDASGQYLVLSKLVATTAKGTKVYSDIIVDMNPGLNKVNGELVKLEANLKKVKKEQEEGLNIWQSLGESLFGFTHNSEAALKRVAKATNAVTAAKKEADDITAKSPEVKQLQAATDAVTRYEAAQDALSGSLEYTTTQLDKMGKTKQDRLTEQLETVTKSINPLKHAVKEAAASIKTLKGLAGDNTQQIKLQTDTMEKQQQLIISSTAAQKRLTAEIANKGRVKAFRDELSLIRQLAAEEKSRAKHLYDASDKLPVATEKYYNTLTSLARANQANELALLDTQLLSNKEYQIKKLIIESKGRQASESIAAARTLTMRESLKERVRIHGNAWENILADLKAKTYKADGIGRQLADSFKGIFSDIGSTIQTEIGKAFGFIEDKAETTFQRALKSAQKAYQGMVTAANEAFGLGQRGLGIDEGRSLEDIERQRVRDIADLTAKRNIGGVDQAGFDQGLQDIGTGVRRAKEDLGIEGARSEEDLQTERGDSLLEAQLALNEAMLEAEKEFADAKSSIWDDMYAGIKETVFSTLTEIAVQKAAMWAWEMIGESTKNTAEVTGTATAAGAKTAIKSAESAAGVGLAAPGIIAQFTSFMGPFGPPVAAGIIAGLMGMVASAVIPSFSAAPMPSVTPPTAKKFHTGGIVSGANQEIPITAYKGEGVLNTYNGMKAVGGQQGLDKANATGSLTNTQSNRDLIIVIKDQNDNTKEVLTVQNFEEKLRGPAGKAMRRASKDGVILVEA